MVSIKKPIRIDIWHNILWANYKGEVFSALFKLYNKEEFDIRFFQFAETEGNRIGIADIDLSHHRYPFDLIFRGSSDNVNLIRRISALFLRTFKSDADLILLTGYEKIECWLQLLLIKLKGKKAAIFCDSTIYDNKKNFFKGILKRILFKSVDGIFGYGLRSKEYVMHYGADPEKFHYRCQAAALPFDFDQSQALVDRLTHVVKSNSPCYLYIGRLSVEKALETLFYAFSKVKVRKPSATLRIVGGGPDLDNLKKLSRSLKLGSAVCFTGSKSGTELFTEYSRATCLVLPSRSEPWGLVVNEALSYGCPVIVSENCGCVPELVIEGKTGFVHKVDDVNDLAAKMLVAPEHFSDIKKTVQTCTGLMTDYTPNKAATQILKGTRVILRNKLPKEL